MRAWHYRLGYAGILLLMLCPILLLASVVAGLSLPLLLLLGAGHVGGALLLPVLLPRYYRLVGFVGFPLVAVAEALLLPHGLMALWAVLPLFACSLVVMLLSWRASAGWPDLSLFSGGIALCIAVYAFSSLQGVESIQGALLFLGGTLTCLAVVMINLNTQRDATTGRSTGPLLVGNLALVLGMIALLLVLVNIGALRAWVGAAARTVIGALLTALAWLMSLFANGGGSGEPAGEASPLPLLEAQEPSLLTQILNIVFLVVGLLLALALLVLLARMIGGRLRGLLTWLLGYRKVREAQLQDFVESHTSLINLRDARRRFRDNMRQRIRKLIYRQPHWEALDTRGKVRFAMQHYRFLRGKPPGSASATAAELLSTAPLPDADRVAFAETYNRARYSTQPMTVHDERVAGEMRRVP